MQVKINCILLIDDDLVTNFIIKNIIRDMGVADNLIVKNSAELGLEYLMESGRPNAVWPFPNLILLEPGLPLVSGWEFIDQFKKLKSGMPFHPIIMMVSTLITERDILKASFVKEQLGLYAKPLTSELFEILVNEFFFAANKNHESLN